MIPYARWRSGLRGRRRKYIHGTYGASAVRTESPGAGAYNVFEPEHDVSETAMVQRCFGNNGSGTWSATDAPVRHGFEPSWPPRPSARPGRYRDSRRISASLVACGAQLGTTSLIRSGDARRNTVEPSLFTPPEGKCSMLRTMSSFICTCSPKQRRFNAVSVNIDIQV